MAALEKAAWDREQEESFRKKQVREREGVRGRELGRRREREGKVVVGDNSPWGSVEMPGP